MQRYVNLVYFVKRFQTSMYYSNLLAKIGFDTAENGPLKVCQESAKSKKKVRMRIGFGGESRRGEGRRGAGRRRGGRPWAAAAIAGRATAAWPRPTSQGCVQSSSGARLRRTRLLFLRAACRAAGRARASSTYADVARRRPNGSTGQRIVRRSASASSKSQSYCTGA